MYIEGTEISCGVSQIADIYKTKEKKILEIIFNSQCTFYIWSDTTKAKNGDRLAAIIKKHKLGTVTRAKPTINPVTKNEITVFTWRVNQKAMLAFAKKKYPHLLEIEEEDKYY